MFTVSKNKWLTVITAAALVCAGTTTVMAGGSSTLNSSGATTALAAVNTGVQGRSSLGTLVKTRKLSASELAQFQAMPGATAITINGQPATLMRIALARQTLNVVATSDGTVRTYQE